MKSVLRKVCIFMAFGFTGVGLQSFQSSNNPSSQLISPQINQSFLVAQIDWQQIADFFRGKKRPGRQRAGYSRPDCPVPKDSTSKLTALIPSSNYGTTTYNNPTFWFYVPYSQKQIVSGEFSLQDDGTNVIPPVSFRILNTPGFVKITLPPGTKLAAGKEYEWLFELYCTRDKSPTTVNGKIERIEISGSQNQLLEKSSSKYDFFISNGIWFDTIDEIMSYRRKNRNTPSTWEQLLELSTVDLRDIKSIDSFGDIELSPKE
jgi:hypothetical protein